MKPGKVEFNRPPRIRSVLTKRRVEIPTPPAPPPEPSRSVVSALAIPLVTVVLSSSAYFLFAASNPNMDRTPMIMAAVVLALGTAVPSLWMFIEERRTYRRRTRDQETAYRRRLRSVEADLERLRNEETAIRTEQDPSFEVLLQRAIELRPRLWERRPVDDDFLVVRFGLGLATSYLEIVRTGGDSESELGRSASQLAERYRRVPDVPVLVDLKRVTALGLAGPFEEASALARSVLCQVAAHHSPDELLLAAFIDGDHLTEWAWLKWLPHTRSQRTVDGAQGLLAWDTAGRESIARWLLNELTNRRRALAETGAGASRTAPPPPWLFIFADDFASVQAEPALQLVFTEGARLRVSLMGLALDLALLPEGCGGVAVVGNDPDGLLTYANAGPQPDLIQCVPDQVSPEMAEVLARALAPVSVAQHLSRAEADLPSRMSLFEALEIDSAQLLDVEGRWNNCPPSKILRVPLGPGPAGSKERNLVLDIKEQAQGGHGPHGLVAGTTGSGKSELLLTIIAGLALEHPPDVLNFVLVDYKGGDAFRAVADLPHTVALTTDLDQHLASRALAFLKSELKRRERRLGELKRNLGIESVAEYQQFRGSDPMPFLVIVVDEFARLKAELPEFIHGLVDVARVGRSLGVHLILATQTPSGTVDEEIQKNVSFGLCLRVRDASDSQAVIGQPDAFLLPGSIPGRAYAKLGQDPVKLFQAARASARYQPRVEKDPIVVSAFPPEPYRTDGNGSTPALPSRDPEARETEIDMLVAKVRETAKSRGLKAKRWPEPLPSVVPLFVFNSADGLPGGVQPLFPTPSLDKAWRWPSSASHDWMTAPIGLLDEPAQQEQEAFRLDVSRNCIVYGAPGSGKSTLLRTLALALALTHSPKDLHMYCLDFGERALRALRRLPHCGEAGVFYPSETDRIRRLFRMLAGEVVRRREAGVTNLKQQRRANPLAESFPFAVVLLDNFAAFRETFEEEEQRTRSQEHIATDLVALMRDGPAVGIHVVVTAFHASGVTMAVANAAERRLTLRQNDLADYSVVGRFEAGPGKLPPGRGFFAGAPPLEFQIAIPTQSYSLGEDVSELRVIESFEVSDDPRAQTDGDVADDFQELFAQLQMAAHGYRPPAIQELPSWVAVGDQRMMAEPADRLGSSMSFPIRLGLDAETLSPVLVDLAEARHLVLLGPPGSGKTTLLITCLLTSLSSQLGSRARWYVVSLRTSGLQQLTALPNDTLNAGHIDAVSEMLTILETIVGERRSILRLRRGSNGPADSEEGTSPILLVLDDYELLRQEDERGQLDERLANVAKLGGPMGLYVIVSGSNVELRGGSGALMRYLSQQRVGILLQPDVEVDGQLFSVSLRRLPGAVVPPGRGFFVKRQSQRLFQAATCQQAGATLGASVEAWVRAFQPTQPHV